jgi:hypothetical protein
MPSSMLIILFSVRSMILNRVTAPQRRPSSIAALIFFPQHTLQCSLPPRVMDGLAFSPTRSLGSFSTG